MKYYCPTLFLLIFMLASCTTEALDIHPNGDSRIREISFKNRVLNPNFSPLTYEYNIYADGQEIVLGKVVPFIFHTKFYLNGKSVRMDTNGYKLPDFTDLTGHFTNASTSDGTKVLVIDSTAMDGNKRKYTVFLRGRQSDAGIASVTTTNAVFTRPYFEYPAPLYRQGTNASPAGVDVYNLTVNTNYAVLIFEKNHDAARLFSSLNPTSEIGAGSKTGVLWISNIATGFMGTNFYVTNFSADGKLVNTKRFFFKIIEPAKDARLMSIDVKRGDNGQSIPYLPRYLNTDVNQEHTLVVDDHTTIDITGSKSQPETVLSLTINDVTNDSYITQDHTSRSYSISRVPVNMGDKIVVTSKKGTQIYKHVFNVRAFTKNPYGFDGKISELLRDIQNKKEIVKGSGYSKVIEGVVTFITGYNEGFREGWFIEDGAYGMYVWSYNGSPNATAASGTSASNYGLLKVGHRIKMTVTAAKLWMNMPEVTDAVQAETVILDNGKRYPLHYIDGNDMQFGEFRHLGRIMRYSTYKAGMPINATYDDNGMGNFTSTKAFKLFFPYTKSLKDLRDEYKPESLEYMTEGKHGIFFGPSFLDGDGASIMMKGKEYMIVP